MSRQDGHSSQGTNNFSDPQLIAQIAGWLEQAGVSAIEIEQADRTVRISVESTAVSAQALPPAGPQSTATAAKTAPHCVPVKAPMAGHYLDIHPSGKVPQSGVGTAVGAGQIVGFIKVGPVLVALEAPGIGAIGAPNFDTGALVGFGDTLCSIERLP